MRKQFRPTERTAIGRAIEEELGNRRGQRTDIAAIAAKSDAGRTVDLAAKRAGFKSAESFKRAKTVVDRGIPELKAAIDMGDIKIDAAAKIATQPKADQKRIVNMPKDQQREVVRQIRKTKADKEANERRARDVFRRISLIMGDEQRRVLIQKRLKRCTVSVQEAADAAYREAVQAELEFFDSSWIALSHAASRDSPFSSRRPPALALYSSALTHTPHLLS